MANSGGTDSNDTQFFINTGSIVSTLNPPFYGFTTFGQLVSGQATRDEDGKRPAHDRHDRSQSIP